MEKISRGNKNMQRTGYVQFVVFSFSQLHLKPCNWVISALSERFFSIIADISCCISWFFNRHRSIIKCIQDVPIIFERITPMKYICLSWFFVTRRVFDDGNFRPGFGTIPLFIRDLRILFCISLLLTLSRIVWNNNSLWVTLFLMNSLFDNRTVWYPATFVNDVRTRRMTAKILTPIRDFFVSINSSPRCHRVPVQDASRHAGN